MAAGDDLLFVLWDVVVWFFKLFRDLGREALRAFRERKQGK